MKTPAYETSAGALAALLATRQFVWAGLYKFVLVNGGTLYLSTQDVNITFGGNTYLTAASSGLLIERKGARGKLKLRIGMEVDTLQFDIMPNGGTVNGQPFLAALKQGAFDGADVTFYHAYWPLQAYAPVINPTGVVTMFAGRVAPVNGSRTVANFTVNSYLDLLNINLPRAIYQGGCVNTLFDAGCTLSAATYAVASTALTGSTSSLINITSAQATGYFDSGKITFTSGANNGLSRSVKQYIKGTPGTIEVTPPLPNVPASGDTFNAYPGCDRLMGTCINKFANLANFRGEPFIPENSTGV